MELGWSDCPDTLAESLGKDGVVSDDGYRRRSPLTFAAKLEKPLLGRRNTTDETVHVIEVPHLIDALKSADMKFEYKIDQTAPGGHHFNRIEAQLALQSRQEITSF